MRKVFRCCWQTILHIQSKCVWRDIPDRMLVRIIRLAAAETYLFCAHSRWLAWHFHGAQDRHMPQCFCGLPDLLLEDSNNCGSPGRNISVRRKKSV